MAKETILVVDDEEDILELVRHHLKREGFAVQCADSGEKALTAARNSPVNLMVLDLMLPGIDGLEVTRRLKNDPQTKHIPILMLSAKGEESDVVTGLELGADDYVTKPFSPRILIARTRAILRRGGNEPPDETKIIRVHDIEIHPGRRSVTILGQPVSLTYTEFQVLSILARRPGLGIYPFSDRGYGTRRRLPGDRPFR